MPYPGPFNFSQITHYSYDFCPLRDSVVGLSIIVQCIEHTFFHLGLFRRKFVLCLFG